MMWVVRFTWVAVVVSITVIVRAARADSADLARIVARGEIHRSRGPQAGEEWIPLYLGNGRFGCCFGPWGLHAAPGATVDYQPLGVTRFVHMKHWVRAKYNADYLLPLAAIHWASEPQAVTEYEQHQSFHDGTVRTRFRTDAYTAEVLSWIDPVHRDVAGFRIDVQGEVPPILVVPLRDLTVHYQGQLRQSFAARLEGNAWQARLRCLDRETPLSVKTTARMAAVDDGVELTLSPGRNYILVGVSDRIDVSGEDSFRSSVGWWHATWGDCGWLDLPDETAQKVWIRALAYVFYSHNDDGLGCSPPTGLSGAGWPFPFPFDSGCRHPLLLWTGRIDVARAWIEFYRSRSDGLKVYTRRIWGLDGMMLPHVFPYGPAEGYHDPEAPNENYYPVYNAGNMVRMAHQTAVMVNDLAWTREVAAPLIEGAARFYLDMARRVDDGICHFSIVPSLGLDENGGLNQPDYLCTLVAAEHSLRQAVAYGLDRDGRMAAILRDGIAYKALLSDGGYYYANAGEGARDFGRQKHPDQLTALVHLPLGSRADDPTRRSHELRYDITTGAKRPSFIGHTSGEFLLASARMQDAEAWRKDWANIAASGNADAEWIQLYESCGGRLIHYVTTHGLIAQAILETVVSTWWERLDLAPCIPWPGRVRFGNLRTLVGVTVSGEVTDGRGHATLTAWKDTSFPCGGRTITLKQGERIEVEIPLRGKVE